MKAISDGIFKVEKIVVIILIPVMLLAMVFDIFFRYFVQSPLVWAQELTLYTFVWCSFIGASMSVKSKEAVAVTLFVDKINAKLRNVLIIAGLIISAVFCVFVFSLSINWITNPSILLQKSITTQTPMIFMYICIPVSLLFMSIHFVNWFLESIKCSREGKVIE
ncbi:TRAP transporter small permease [Bacillus sp. 1P02SD]|uniref:TRAP transporter small permease n=1 Tax=Bacillus sp. 1P02SD TaxID=3132264 RepID=UPI0039A168E5